MDMRKGPWTDEEDSLLINYVTLHGEGHWNSLSRCAGLRRTGKSCRLRWLNYLRPDVRRGNITLQEQLLILQLHSRWGNRWSKIAEHLPGRTDNEIKNYWRTRVQKQAKQMKCDVDSKQFKDTMSHIWIPRLAERIQAQSRSSAGTTTTTTHLVTNQMDMGLAQTFINMGSDYEIGLGQAGPTLNPEMSGYSSSSLETQVSPVSDLTDFNDFPGGNYYGTFQNGSGYCPEFVASPPYYGFQQDNAAGLGYDEDSFEDIRFLLQQFNYGL